MQYILHCTTKVTNLIFDNDWDIGKCSFYIYVIYIFYKLYIVIYTTLYFLQFSYNIKMI